MLRNREVWGSRVLVLVYRPPCTPMMRVGLMQCNLGPVQAPAHLTYLILYQAPLQHCAIAILALWEFPQLNSLQPQGLCTSSFLCLKYSVSCLHGWLFFLSIYLKYNFHSDIKARYLLLFLIIDPFNSHHNTHQTSCSFNLCVLFIFFIQIKDPQKHLAMSAMFLIASPLTSTMSGIVSA